MSRQRHRATRSLRKSPLVLLAGAFAWFHADASAQDRLQLPVVEESIPQINLALPPDAGPTLAGPNTQAPPSAVRGYPLPPPGPAPYNAPTVDYSTPGVPATGVSASRPSPYAASPVGELPPGARAYGVPSAAAAGRFAHAPAAAPTDLAPRRDSQHDFSGLHDDLLDTAIRVTQEPPPVSIEQVPPGWWTEMATRPLRESPGRESLTLDHAMMKALSCSFQIKVFSELPQIRETAIIEADAAFDWTQFVDTRWNDRSDPIGNSLTAGPGVTRFLDQQWTGRAGLKKKTTTGGQVEIGQNFGYQDNNSVYFIPAPQGTARLTLGFTQPLLRGSGKAYNTSLTYLASIDKDIADDELRRQVQTHLLEVSRAYWALYFERGLLYQKLRSYRRAEEIVNHLRPRRELDASQIQIVSAEAALTERKSDLSRAFAAVRNAEARLRALINDPALGNSESVEIVPADRPAFVVFPVDLQSSVAEAFHARPEVGQALKQIKAAGVRKNMSQNELLPMLNLVTETYVAGLKGSGDIGNAWVEQFNTGRPSYSVGLVFEIPLGNRAAIARDERRAMELRQLQSQYAVTLETVRLEVEVAVREVQTSQLELLAKSQAVKAREDQLFNLSERWTRLPPTDATTPLLLENILDAQALLAATEQEYLKAQVTYSLSLQSLRRATGTLLQVESTQVMPVNNPPPASAPSPTPRNGGAKPSPAAPSSPATPRPAAPPPRSAQAARPAGAKAPASQTPAPTLPAPRTGAMPQRPSAGSVPTGASRR